MASLAPYMDSSYVARIVGERRGKLVGEQERYRETVRRLKVDAEAVGSALVAGFTAAGVAAWAVTPALLARIGNTFGQNLLGIVFRSADGRMVGLVASVPVFEQGRPVGFFTFEMELDGVRVDADGVVSDMDVIRVSPAFRGSGSLRKVCEWVIDYAATMETAR